eukprot:scaffold4163_cov425-Prasinococcus_capsulatus_cf.AAC.17
MADPNTSMAVGVENVEYTLTYFPHRAASRADAAMLLFAMAHTPLRVRRVAFPGFLALRDDEDKLRKSSKDAVAQGPNAIRLPFRQLPVLERRMVLPAEGGFKLDAIGQSKSILRLAAKLAKMYPADAWSAAKVDSVIDRLDDLGSLKFYFAGEDEAQKMRACEELLNTSLPPIISDLATMARGGEWLVDGELSAADIVVFATLHEVATQVLRTQSLASKLSSATWVAVLEQHLAALPGGQQVLSVCERVSQIKEVGEFVADNWTDATDGITIASPPVHPLHWAIACCCQR